jgi:hypothetical protein
MLTVPLDAGARQCVSFAADRGGVFFRDIGVNRVNRLSEVLA